VVFHILVDAGMGTISSLARADDFGFPKRIDLILITHGHIDHHSELVYACEIPVRMRRRKDCLPEFATQPQPIPVYAPGAPSIAARRLGELYHYSMACHEEGTTEQEKERIAAEAHKKNGWIYPVHSLCPTNGRLRSRPVSEGPDPDHQFKITPIGGVKHADCLIYVVEFGKNQNERKKIVFAWDMECLPWDDGLSASDAQEAESLLKGADLMFVEMNTCLQRTTGHISYVEVAEFVAKTQPKECYVVHYSGFEDQFPGDKDRLTSKFERIMCLDQLDQWLEGQCQKNGCLKVRAARHGFWYPARKGRKVWIWS
jgi:ribonuclease BN (tRNA processing enzyme)